MDKDTLFLQVRQLLLFKEYPQKIKPTSSLQEDLHMDKFDMAVLKKGIANKYEVSFTKEEYQKWKTVEDILIAVLSKKS